MANFDDEGDALIASVLEDSENPDTKLEFGRLIDTKWPEIINHPEFIGSHFMVTAFSLDDGCIYFKATADKIQQNRIGKTLITFKDVTQIDNQRNLATVTIAIDDIFSAVHLPLYNEEQNQTEMSVDHQPSPVTEQDFFEFEPQRTSTMEKQQQNSQIDIPLISEGLSVLIVALVSSIAVLGILIYRFNLPMALGISLLSGLLSSFVRHLLS